MRLTTKGRFAVTAMLDLALNADESPICLSSISERQHISLSYLEQLFGKLRRAGLVDSVRGSCGGYRLSKSPEKISVADIINAVDEPIDATQCSGKGGCQSLGHGCITHDLWTELNSTIFAHLSQINLEQLKLRHPDKNISISKNTNSSSKQNLSINSRAENLR